MSNSTYCDDHYEQPSWMKEIEDLEKKVKQLTKEPVSKVWHDASEEPKPNMELICVGQYGNPLVLSSNSDSFKSRDISKWAYFNDLLNLSNIERNGKNWKEEPVSIDFEQELYKAFGQVKDFTLGMRIAKWFYDMGKNSHVDDNSKKEE